MAPPDPLTSGGMTPIEDMASAVKLLSLTPPPQPLLRSTSGFPSCQVPKNGRSSLNCKIIATTNSWTRITPSDDPDRVECFIQEDDLPPNAVIAMLDMDAFEVQIYLKKVMGVEKGREMYLTTPCILADPSTDRIIAVNFLAKAKGISRQDRVGSAKEKCPDIYIIRKGVRFDKPENINLRHSSWEVLDSILKFREEKQMKFAIEYASNDEYYIDLTYPVDCWMANEKLMESLNEEQIGVKTFLETSEKTVESSEIIETFHHMRLGESVASEFQSTKITLQRLIMGCTILEEIRNYVFSQTNFEGSAGIAVNKLLAKLATPLHKPGGITILPRSGLFKVSANIPVQKLPRLGGELGKMLREWMRKEEHEGQDQEEGNTADVTIQELATLPFSKLLTGPEGRNLWEMMILRKLAQGISNEPVVEKLMKMTATVGRANLRGLRFHQTQRIYEVIFILVAELMERLEEEERRHKRIPEAVLVGFQYIVFPPKGEDRDRTQPPLAENFAYAFNPSIGEPLNSSSQELANAVFENVVQIVQNKGESGIITKMNFMIRAFRGVE